MVRTGRPTVVVVTIVAALCAWPAGAGARTVRQTLVFDAVAHESFVDTPPAGPSPGDTEHSTARLRDAAGHFVGTARTTCVFTKLVPHDVLERCSASARTTEGTVSLAGVGHLYSLNPPWRVTGGSGAYRGVHGSLIFETDIALDPNVPLANGRGFSVDVLRVTSERPLHVGVVSRPSANAQFIRSANAACNATAAREQALPPFPYSTFDPFHPDPSLLPKVGRFFATPARHRLPRTLLGALRKLGQPPANREVWKSVLTARQTLLTNENTQIRYALADDAPAFVRTVYQGSRDVNALVFRSAVFGVQSCTFG